MTARKSPLVLLGSLVLLGAGPSATADVGVTLFEALDGSTDVEIRGSGQTTDSGSAVFSAGMLPQFLGADDNSEHLGTIGTLAGNVGGRAVLFVPGLRVLDGAAADTVQFNIGDPYAMGDSYSFSGVGNFPTLDFADFTRFGVSTSTAGDATDFAEFTGVVVPEPQPGLLAGVAMLCCALVRARAATCCA